VKQKQIVVDMQKVLVEHPTHSNLGHCIIRLRSEQQGRVSSRAGDGVLEITKSRSRPAGVGIESFRSQDVLASCDCRKRDHLLLRSGILARVSMPPQTP